MWVGEPGSPGYLLQHLELELLQGGLGHRRLLLLLPKSPPLRQGQGLEGEQEAEGEVQRGLEIGGLLGDLGRGETLHQLQREGEELQQAEWMQQGPQVERQQGCWVVEEMMAWLFCPWQRWTFGKRWVGRRGPSASCGAGLGEVQSRYFHHPHHHLQTRGVLH